MPPSFRYERDHPEPCAGVDEAGRGPLAGPVVAAAVILDRRRVPRGIDDSKKLTEAAREGLYDRIVRSSTGWGVGIVDVEEIDRLNIYHATMLAMSRAVDALGVEPGMVLVDGNALPKWRHPARAIVSGDALSRSIAAASIIAKVTRDRMMQEYDGQYPGYGWRQNKGYGTAEHRAALIELGPTPLHRRSFAPVAQLCLAL
ncbi:MAG: ribonuclease HII [Sphingomonas oligoaromativorans]|jgi:ribonuclease HII|uniref:ribonuclease HII n=1 Tax=Sphingomonas oligoaromativorans TaxID=575322 RepID=UPI00141F0BDC|nr:ribonuclease HII [Sphingomonas oligoaromativorans]NIJ31948.1 ribonuclease HII [Sphingomonas oligoaromativorans]